MNTVTAQIDQLKPVWKERFRLPIYLAVLGALAVTAINAPGLIKFWPFSPTEFMQRIAPLFLISLFIERALEVFVTAWRGPEANIRNQKIKALRKGVERGEANTEDLAKVCEEKERCKSKMQRIAFGGSVMLGLFVSSVGVRALGSFVDDASFRTLSEMQQASFKIVDVLLTGAMLGGGSDALHKFVTVFTNFMERTAMQAKGDTE